MRHFHILGCIILLLSICPPVFAKSQCVICHKAMGEKQQRIVRKFHNDIHSTSGLSCHSCHGGNPRTDDIMEAKGEESGFIGAPSRQEIPRFCGRCHSNPSYMKKYNPALPVDQEEKYHTSMHGKKLKAGDAKVATCTGCHPAHSIRGPKDPLSSVYPRNVPKTCGRCHSNPQYMAGYKIPTDQFKKYASSIHGKALLEKGDMAVPACNDCHGNHGAMPPGIADISHVCGLCHPQNMQYLQENPMAKAWKKKKIHTCAACHNHHDIMPPSSAMLSGEKSVCKRCHIPSDKGYAVGAGMKHLIDELDDKYRQTVSKIEAAEEKGMDVSEAHDMLSESRHSLFHAKTIIHTFRLEKVLEVSNKGLKSLQKAFDIAENAVKEFRWRRIGLGILTLIITLLVLGIYFKIREIEGT